MPYNKDHLPYTIYHLRFLFTLSLLLFLLSCGSPAVNQQPNIIYIMIDDLGYGDLGCYGSEFNTTPNIDRLAAGGMLLRDFHSNGPMCSPTRAAFMTGLYQNRFGSKFESAISGKTDYDTGLPLEAVTIAEKLKEHGYTTGMYGKWHLGYKPPFLPTNQGFDEFVGLGAGDGDHHSHVDRWGREDWWHNNTPAMEQGYSTDLITEHSIQFIEKNKQTPFFLFVSHLSIHFPWQGPDDPPHRVAGREYSDDKWGIIPDRNNIRPHVKAMLESIDAGVGRIMKSLRNLGLVENTLIIFTSDNGGYIHYADSHFNISSNGPLRGQKTEVYEGGHRVPFIAYWPGRIKPGAHSDDLAMTMDMFPTFLQLAGIRNPAELDVDGISIVGHLLDGQALPERTLFWKMDDEWAVRRGNWKLCRPESGSLELFDLDADIGETENLVQEKPEIVDKLKREYEVWLKDVTKGR